MSVVIDYDVIVIGAGPGGCSTAIRLAEFGFKVAIIERQAYPRSHVGICISDQTIALLEFLNISEQFYGANYWRRNLTAISWGEQEFHTFPQPGFHVNRGTLDQFLLDRAHAVGATVYQPAQVLKLSQKNCAYREAEVKFGPCNLKLRTHFIVDAAGRCQSIPGTQVRDSEPLVALCASWSLTQRPAVDGAIESGDDAWLWFARTSQDSAVVSIFCDPRSLRSEKKLILQDSYSKFLSQFLFLRSSSFGEQSSEVTICNASSYHSVNPVGDKHIRVGDACLSIDPLSSQGVHLALQSGIQAAVVVRTILEKPENMKIAKQFYEQRITERVALYVKRTQEEYARVTDRGANSFWQERSKVQKSNISKATKSKNLSQPTLRPKMVTLSPNAIVELTPVIKEDFVTERQALRHPRLKSAVAYVEGFDIIPLIYKLPQICSFSDIPRYWASKVPMNTAKTIALWLWDNGLLEDAF